MVEDVFILCLDSTKLFRNTNDCFLLDLPYIEDTRAQLSSCRISRMSARCISRKSVGLSVSSQSPLKMTTVTYPLIVMKEQ